MPSLSPLTRLILYCWAPAVVFVAIITVLRAKLAHRLRWKSMLLRVTAIRVDDANEAKLVITEKERRVLSTLLQNITLMSALGATLALSLLIAPTEIIYDASDGQELTIQYFILLTFASTGTYVMVVIESALSLLYLEQYTDSQLHAILCQRATELFVEPLLAFITATLYMLAAGIVFCGYLYGRAAVIGLSTIVVIPVYKIAMYWFYLERFDSQSFALARKIETGRRITQVDHDNDNDGDDEDTTGANAPAGTIVVRLARQGTVVGQSKLLEAMKRQRDEKRRTVTTKTVARRLRRLRSGGDHGVSVSA